MYHCKWRVSSPLNWRGNGARNGGGKLVQAAADGAAARVVNGLNGVAVVDGGVGVVGDEEYCCCSDPSLVT